MNLDEKEEDNMDEIQELDALLKAYSKLSEERKKEEINNKLKELLALTNQVNSSSELLMLPGYSEKNDLVFTYLLIHSLENEITKLVDKLNM